MPSIRNIDRISPARRGLESYRFGKRCDEGGYFFDQLRVGSVLGDAFHDRRSDDDGVAAHGNGVSMFGCADSEAHGNRQ